MSDDLISPSGASLQPLLPNSLAQAGEKANQAASRHRFEEYRLRRSEQTLRRQDSELHLFSIFLKDQLGVEVSDLRLTPDAWTGITWGIIEAYLRWELQHGYAVQTVNVHLSTIKAYTRLAMQAGGISTQEYAMIRAVRGFTHKEQLRIDQRREIKRIGLKKAKSVLLTSEQAVLLKSQPDTPQGRRDRLIFCLLLDHGLRVGELAALTVDEFDLQNGLLRFFRPKVGKEQIHRLSEDTVRALHACTAYAELIPKGSLLRRTWKDGSLGPAGITDRAITLRVSELGKVIGVFGLSAHDCRHYWATTAARHGTDLLSLQQAGGWSSLAMPRRYVEDNDIANDGLKLE